jgi:tripartite-type tricarboxylate transporter receptor subunit TctC
LLFQDAIKSSMTLIPYKGTAPAMTDLMGGQVDIMCEQATNSAPQIEGKKVKAYGITSAKRSQAPALANIPTMSEAGLKGFNFTVWHGLYAPKGTPPDVVKKINEALKVALKDSELVKRQEALGISVISDSRVNPVDHKKFVNAEVAKWAKVIRDAGIQPE